MYQYELRVTGENALILYFTSGDVTENSQKGAAFAAYIKKHSDVEYVDIVPANNNVTFFYQTLNCSLIQVKREIRHLFTAWSNSSNESEITSRIREVPVYYGPEVAFDIDDLSLQLALSCQEIKQIHLSAQYQVTAVGFAPGFPYMHGLNAKLETSRKQTPRIQVPAGAVAIAELQTAIYPTQSAGGWHIIGNCPLPMFSLENGAESYLAVGDNVRFVEIKKPEYLAMGGQLDLVVR